MESSQPTPPLSSVVPTQSFTPSEQNPIVVHPKHHPILGGIALVVALSLSILGGKLLYANYWAGSTDDVYVVSQTQRPSPSPTSSVPADWKTYTNTEYGFEVKFLPTWNQYSTIQSSFTTSNKIVIHDILFLTPCGDVATSHFSISVWPISEYTRAKQESITEGSPFPPVEVARNNTSVYTYTHAQDGCPEAAWMAADVDWKKVINTFKFTSPTSSVPADWKTYSSKYFTLSFKIPPKFVVTEEQNAMQLFYGEPQPAEYGAPANQVASILRFNQSYSKDVAISNFKQYFPRNFHESTIVIDGRSFPLYSGSAVAGEGGCGTENVLMVPFNLSSFTTCGPSSWNPHMTPDLAKQILSTFRFSK